MKMFVVVMGAMFAMSACDKKPEAAAGAAAGGAAAGDSGASTCDKYTKTMEACIAKMPEAAQGPAKDGLKQASEMFKQIPDKTALEAACKTAWDAAKQGMGAACPDVKWE